MGLTQEDFDSFCWESELLLAELGVETMEVGESSTAFDETCLS